MIHGKHQGYGYGKPDESKSKVHDEKVRVCGNVGPGAAFRRLIALVKINCRACGRRWLCRRALPLPP